MNESCGGGTTGRSKTEVIAEKVEELWGKLKRIQYEEAVIAYAIGCSSKFETRGDSRLELIWEKTKEIVDSNRERRKYPRYSDYQKLLDSLEQIERGRLQALSSMTGAEVDSLEELPPELLEFIEDRARCDAILSSDPEWGSYEELIELIVTGHESKRANYLYGCASRYLEAARNRGIQSTYDEMLNKVIKAEAKMERAEYGSSKNGEDRCLKIFGRKFEDIPWFDLEELLGD